MSVVFRLQYISTKISTTLDFLSKKELILCILFANKKIKQQSISTHIIIFFSKWELFDNENMLLRKINTNKIRHTAITFLSDWFFDLDINPIKYHL